MVTEGTPPIAAKAGRGDACSVLTGVVRACARCCWSQDGSLVKAYQTNGDIYEVSWNKAGDRIAACVSSGDVAIISFRV